MELPFTVVFEPPTRKELRALLRMRRTWLAIVALALAIGAIHLVATFGRADAVASAPAAPLQVTSQPPRASVWLDERSVGETPLQLGIGPGVHSLVLKAADALDAHYAVRADVTGADLHAVLWRRQPVLSRLRSTLPGAALSNVELLADGNIALSLGLPIGHQVQAWRLDAGSGAVEPLLISAAGDRLRVSPDGRVVAVLGYDVGPPVPTADFANASTPRTSMLWLTESDATVPARAWRPPLARSERLVDVSWSPRGDRLLAIAGEQFGGRASASRVWLLDASSLDAREMLTLPSDVVAGSEVWSPDGLHVAFVAHAPGINALCLLDVYGGFRYVADLDVAAEQPHGYPTAAWSPDSQRLLFVAPRQRPPGASPGWLQPPEPARLLYVAETAEPTPIALGMTSIDMAAWREDGQILGLGRLGPDGALDLRLMSGSAAGEHLLELPLKPGDRYAASWDVARARVVIAAPSRDGALEFWLVRLGWEPQA